ncbi:DUF4099 domain-containing protein [Pedobacter sp. Hv1]|uniref:DUF4099 domain-containing protein n=1 Tax=Pedobacter sp. Hv1 TaxID=1740090 RepID=UPI0006D8B1AD|nr:DUF4099 domain-containing protein [Pedobacter sp. Hv1]KQB99855.1 hypothetical protein AQF98_15170 [Pedobacter sp. Hv1]
METPIKENELPIKELERLGLYQNGKPKMASDNLDALLAGRRTDMLSMENLQLDGFTIRQLDAKLSLTRNEKGKVELNLHPIYKQAISHPLLSEEESRNLQSGKLQSVQKAYEQADKKLALLAIEYDQQTKEFIVYRPDHVEVPLKVNGETLSEKQKKSFRNGELVELGDGTRFQHSATDSKGVRSDTKHLILSVLLDGGISYLLFKGVRNLVGNSEKQKEEFTKGYDKAMKEVMDQTKKDRETGNVSLPRNEEHSHKPQQDRGYGRNASR